MIAITMASTIILVFTFVSVLSATWVDDPRCGYYSATPVNENGNRIFGGSAPYQGELPWIVYLRIGKAKGNSKCTGGIIHEQWIITAAHCLEGVNGNIDVIYSRVDPFMKIYGGERSIAAVFGQNVFVPPARGSDKSENDVGLIYLRDQQPFPLPKTWNDHWVVNRMCLLPPIPFSYDPGEEVEMAGYGEKGPAGVPAADKNKLTKANQLIDTEQNCRGNFPVFNELISFCTLSITPPSYPHGCGGDSGAPMIYYIDVPPADVVKLSTRRAYSVGVYSRGKSSCGKTKISKTGFPKPRDVSTKVEPYLDWIANTIDTWSPPKPAGPPPEEGWGCTIC